MNSVMEALWYGNISPHDTIVEDYRYYKKLLKLIGQNRDRLPETLTPEMKTVLETYDDNINEMNFIAETEAFRYSQKIISKPLYKWKNRAIILAWAN